MLKQVISGAAGFLTLPAVALVLVAVGYGIHGWNKVFPTFDQQIYWTAFWACIAIALVCVIGFGLLAIVWNK